MSKVFIGISFFVTLVLLGWLIVAALDHTHQSGLSHTEKEKALEAILGRKPVEQEPKQNSNWLEHTSAVMTYSYPSWARVYDEENTAARRDPSTLDSFHFAILATHVDMLLQARKVSGINRIEDDGEIQVREKDSSYTKTAVTSGDYQGIEFDKTDTTVEHTIFFLIQDTLYSISATGYNDDDVLPIFKKVFASLQLSAS